jgi:hypothetical protein
MVVLVSFNEVSKENRVFDNHTRSGLYLYLTNILQDLFFRMSLLYLTLR